MKIISFNVKAGGVGKSTLCFNTAFTLAENGKRVLVLGTDTNMNITKRFVGYYARKHGLSQEELLSEIKPENTVEMLFQGLPFSPIKITDNIDLIAETTTLYSLKKKIVEPSLIYWYWDNEKYLKENYDYILIDTHNDDEIPTRATYAVSDIIAVVVDDSNKTHDIIPVMRQNLAEIKRKNRDRNGSLVNAKIVLLGNRLDDRTLGLRMRNKLNKLRRENPDICAGYIEERTSVKKAEELYLPLSEFKKKDKLTASLERFYRETERTLLRLVDM